MMKGMLVKEQSRLLSLIESGFAALRILVIGDVMLDRSIWGDVDRISPEAPVPVLRSVQTTSAPGGAANVAMNLVGLGVKVAQAGFWGDDGEMRRIERIAGSGRGGFLRDDPFRPSDNFEDPHRLPQSATAAAGCGER